MLRTTFALRVTAPSKDVRRLAKTCRHFYPSTSDLFPSRLFSGSCAFEYLCRNSKSHLGQHVLMLQRNNSRVRELPSFAHQLLEVPISELYIRCWVRLRGWYLLHSDHAVAASHVWAELQKEARGRSQLRLCLFLLQLHPRALLQVHGLWVHRLRFVWRRKRFAFALGKHSRSNHQSLGFFSVLMH